MKAWEKVKKTLKRVWKREEKNRIKGNCEICENYSTELKKWEGKWACPKCRRQEKEEIKDVHNQKEVLK